MTELILSREAEAQTLRQRREELQALEAEIAVREPELIGLQTELLQFERIYLGVVGTRYDDLAEIEKEISRLQGLDIGDEDDGGSGSIANDGANDGANDAVGCGQNRFHADKLKKLYREVARKFHPDLVTCEIERHHRHQLMVEANRAYETGAEDRLNDLLKAGESLESVSDVAMSAEMILLLRKIEEAKSSLAGIEVDTANILASELYRLMRRIEAADTLGVNILNDLVSQVDRQIRKAKNRLEHLRELVVS
jgi:uncharacterized Zn finger protein